MICRQSLAYCKQLPTIRFTILIHNWAIFYFSTFFVNATNFLTNFFFFVIEILGCFFNVFILFKLNEKGLFINFFIEMLLYIFFGQPRIFCKYGS